MNTIYQCLTGVDIELKINHNGFYNFVSYIKDITNNYNRNNQILRMVLNNHDKKILIITRIKNDQLYNMIKTTELDVDQLNINNMTSNSKVLLSTYSNISNINSINSLNIDILIISFPFSFPVLEQLCGIKSLNNPKHIIYIKDEDTIANKYWQSNQHWFIQNEYNIETIDNTKICGNPSN